MQELGTKIIDIITNKDYIKRYIFLSIALLISAINYNLFTLPLGIVTGGANGIATITKYVFDFDPSLIILFISFGVLILSIFFLGKEDTTAATFIAIVYPLFVSLTSSFSRIISVDETTKLLYVIASAIIGGISSGIIYKIGLNTGGLGIVAKIISNRNKISVAKVNSIINGIIIASGSFVFGFGMLFYALITLYISQIVSEKILLGTSNNKMFYIISDKYNEIGKYLMNELNHDFTIFNVRGKFSDTKKKNIMTIIPTREYMSVKDKIKEIDKKAFITITDNYEVVGQDVKINKNKTKKNIISRILSNGVI